MTGPIAAVLSRKCGRSVKYMVTPGCNAVSQKDRGASAVGTSSIVGQPSCVQRPDSRRDGRGAACARVAATAEACSFLTYGRQHSSS